MAQHITHEPQDRYAWVCICGNTPSDDGFAPCDEQGNEVEPIIGGPWNEKFYVCNQCGRIIDQYTLEVVGQRKEAA